MGVSELKQKIQMQIENADERLLEIVSSVLDNYVNEPTSDYETLNSLTLQEKRAIDEALLEVENKQTIPHDLVMEETKKRYPKYFKNEN